MKKLLWCWLAAISAAFLLVACGGGDPVETRGSGEKAKRLDTLTMSLWTAVSVQPSPTNEYRYQSADQAAVASCDYLDSLWSPPCATVVKQAGTCGGSSCQFTFNFVGGGAMYDRSMYKESYTYTRGDPSFHNDQTCTHREIQTGARFYNCYLFSGGVVIWNHFMGNSSGPQTFTGWTHCEPFPYRDPITDEITGYGWYCRTMNTGNQPNYDVTSMSDLGLKKPPEYYAPEEQVFTDWIPEE